VVLDAIQRLQLHHESMEFFGARPEQQIAPLTDAEDGAGGGNAEEVNERSAAVTGRPERRHGPARPARTGGNSFAAGGGTAPARGRSVAPGKLGFRGRTYGFWTGNFEEVVKSYFDRCSNGV